MIEFTETGYVPGLLDGRIRARRAAKDPGGTWHVWMEDGREEIVWPERVFRTKAEAEAEAAKLWPDAAPPVRWCWQVRCEKHGQALQWFSGEALEARRAFVNDHRGEECRPHLILLTSRTMAPPPLEVITRGEDVLKFLPVPES